MKIHPQTLMEIVPTPPQEMNNGSFIHAFRTIYCPLMTRRSMCSGNCIEDCSDNIYEIIEKFTATQNIRSKHALLTYCIRDCVSALSEKPKELTIVEVENPFDAFLEQLNESAT